jgi:predicted DNA-binding transcriptional regulator AlpA
MPPASLPLLVGRRELARLLSRSVTSIDRDDAAGRLPAAVWIGGAKRWRYAEVASWVEAGCPDRATWEALRGAGRASA